MWRIIEDETEFRDAEPQWNQLVTDCRATVFQTWDWLWTCWKHYERNSRLFLGIYEEGNRYLAIVPIIKSNHLFPPIIYRFLGTGVTDYAKGVSDYADLIVHPDHPDLHRSAVGWLLSHVSHLETLRLDQIPRDGATYGSIRRQAQEAGFNTRIVQEVPCHHIRLRPLENVIEGLSAKRRYNIRRYLRKFERDFTLRIADTTNHNGPMETLWEDFAHLHRKRWMQRTQSRDSHTTFSHIMKLEEFLHHACRALSEQGWLDLSVLYGNDQPIAGECSFRHLDTVYAYQSCFEPEFSRYSPSQVLLAHNLQRAWSNGCKIYDLLRGGEEYKSHWMPDSKVNIKIAVESRYLSWFYKGFRWISKR